MTTITASMVKELRERTGLGMMDCKKPLQEADGDMEQAIDDLRKASGLKAAKKSSRAAQGIVMTKIAEDGNYGVVVEVNSETDFAARDDNFPGFAEEGAGSGFDKSRRRCCGICWKLVWKKRVRRWCRKLVRTLLYDVLNV